MGAATANLPVRNEGDCWCKGGAGPGVSPRLAGSRRKRRMRPHRPVVNRNRGAVYRARAPD